MSFPHLSPFSQVTSEHQEREQVHPVSPPDDAEMVGLTGRMLTTQPSLLKTDGSSEELCGVDVALSPPRPCLDSSLAASAAGEVAPCVLKEQQRQSDGESSSCLCVYV